MKRLITTALAAGMLAFAAPAWATCAGPAPSGGDDTSAINSAISACSGVVLLQAGTYNISSTINLKAANNAGLQGLGMLMTMLKSTVTTGTMVQGASSVSGQTFAGIGLTRSTTGNSSSIGFDSGTGQTGATITDVYAEKQGYGFMLHDADTASNASVIWSIANSNDGIALVSNGPDIGWNITGTLSEVNGGNSYTVYGNYGGGGTTAKLTGAIYTMSACGCGTGADSLWVDAITSGTINASFYGDDVGVVDVDLISSNLTLKGVVAECAGTTSMCGDGGTGFAYYTSGASASLTCYNCVASNSATENYELTASGSNVFYGGGAWKGTHSGAPVATAGNFNAYAFRSEVSPSLSGSGTAVVVSSHVGAISCSMMGGCNYYGNF